MCANNLATSILLCLNWISLCRHGGEEGVTCHVISLDSKSDQAAWATRIGMPRINFSRIFSTVFRSVTSTDPDADPALDPFLFS
jgi:hypothetical protein